MASLGTEKFIAVAIAIFCICDVARCDQIESEICSDDKYDEGDLYYKSVRYVLGHLTTDTSLGGYDLYIPTPGPPSYDHVYGHGVCDRELAPADCNSCMEIAVSHLVNDCFLSVGAQIQLQDCRARYESYPFHE